MRVRPLLAQLLLACLPLACGGRPQPDPAPPATASAPAPPPVRPVSALKRTGLTRADREPWRRALGWPADCEEAFQASAVPEAAGVEIYPLSRGRSLVEVRCAWGAYQGSQVYYLYDETRQPPRGEPLTFEVRESPDEKSLVANETPEVWGLPTFDPGRGQLEVLNKFRGPGDCGTLATYRFADGEPHLSRLRAKVACDGFGAEEPEKWAEVPLTGAGGRE